MGSHPQHQMLCGSVYQTTRSGADISAFADPQRAVGLIFVGVQITGKPFYRLLWSRFPTGFGGGVTAMLIRIAEYFSVRKRVHDLEILHRLLAPESTFRLLDVGVGAGSATKRLSRGCGEVTVLEPNRKKLAVGRKRRPAQRVQEGQGESIPSPDEYFDRVGAGAALHHPTDQRQGLPEMRRALRAPGRIVLTELPPPPRPR